MALKNEYLKKNYEELSARYAEQKEFIQAVREFLESVEPPIDEHPDPGFTEAFTGIGKRLVHGPDGMFNVAVKQIHTNIVSYLRYHNRE